MMNRDSIFSIKSNKEVKYFSFTRFEETEMVKHMFTTRIGGVSKTRYISLNLGLNTEDSKDSIMKNFDRVLEVVGNSKDRVVVSNQTHGTNIKIIDEKDLGNLFNRDLQSDGVDGLLTNKPQITLFTFYADCVPLFYLDIEKKVIGLAHAGWRGTVEKIAGKMIEKMIEVYDSKPENILVGIGPSIGSCCYEVDKDVYKKFKNRFEMYNDLLISSTKNKWYLNLWEANKQALEEKGVLRSNIIISGVCTSCNTNFFYSYRKENGKTGRMAAVIQLNKSREGN